MKKLIATIPTTAESPALALVPLLAVVLSVGACTGKGPGARPKPARRPSTNGTSCWPPRTRSSTEQLQAAEDCRRRGGRDDRRGPERARGDPRQGAEDPEEDPRRHARGSDADQHAREALRRDRRRSGRRSAQNLDKLARLESQRKANGRKMASLQSLVDELRTSLEEKDTTIATLEQRVTDLDGKVRDQEGVILAKNDLIREKDDVIDAKTKVMNTAYVAVAGKKMLKTKGVVEKKGSILGLGGTWQETGKYDSAVFREIDTTKEEELAIPAPASKVRVLPGHPGESYRIVSNGPAGSTLKVTDRDAFWRDSRYLVVMIPD